MKPVWRKHLIICLFLGLLAVPIYFLDFSSTGGGGGNWITLDFRGLIFRLEAQIARAALRKSCASAHGVCADTSITTRVANQCE
jgi:hypothetical protein